MSEKKLQGLRNMPYGARALKAVTSLAAGMRLTLSYLYTPSKTVTQQYPENRETLHIPQRFRAQVEMPFDHEGDHNCTACKLCEKSCPNGSISVLVTRDEVGKKILGKYIYRLSQCTFCNLCVEVCPTAAIEMGGGFENATTDRASLDLTLFQKDGLSHG